LVRLWRLSLFDNRGRSDGPDWSLSLPSIASHRIAFDLIVLCRSPVVLASLDLHDLGSSLIDRDPLDLG
jgi:hypothetical protein